MSKQRHQNRHREKQCPKIVVDEAYLRGFISGSVSTVTATKQAARQLTGAVGYPSQTSNADGQWDLYATNHRT